MNTYAHHVRHRNGWGTGFGPRPTHCHQCGESLPRHPEKTGTTGYGISHAETIDSHPDAPELKKGESLERMRAICFKCCAVNERQYMIDHGKITLYLSTERREITNWPGSLKFKADGIVKGHHNMARVRYDAWFTGPDGHAWHGTQYGDDTQLIHCKRLKGQS